MADKKEGMSKAEAVRSAIGDLGRDAKPTQLREHIKTKYGIDMTPGHVKVERQKFFKKELGKGKPAATPKPAAIEAPPQPAPAGKKGPKAGARRKARAGGMTKKEAVQRGLADLGPDAKPAQLKGHIKTKYGIDMTTDHISTVKGNLRSKRKGARKAPAQASAARAAERKGLAPAPAPRGNGHSIGLDDIATAKGLVERIGADSLRKLIDVLAR
jgi:hypothetical protein